MSRAMLEAVYIVVGEGARCLKERRGLDCDELEFVIPKKYATSEVLATLKVWADPKADEKGFVWAVDGVPMRFRFVGNYDHFRYADERLYGPENYRIPNQWKDYWERRNEFV